MLYFVFYKIGNSQLLPAQFMAMAAVGGVVFSGLSGYVAAFCARRSPVIHAGLFGLMMALLYLVPNLLFGFSEPLFFAMMNIAIVLGGSMIGGWVRYWQMTRQRNALTPAEG